MTDHLIATSKLIIEKFENPCDRLKDMLTKRSQKVKQRAEFMRGVELLILTRDHERNKSLRGGVIEAGELEHTFAEALEALDALCWQSRDHHPGDSTYTELTNTLLKTVRLYNSLLGGLDGLTVASMAIVRLGTLEAINAWVREVLSGYHINRPLKADTAREIWFLCEAARFLPPLVTKEGLQDHEAELKFADAGDLRLWFERRFSLMPERLEDYSKSAMDFPRTVEEEIYEAFPAATQGLIMTALGGVASLELMCRYAEGYPSEHIFNLMLNELISETNPLLAWLDFGHVQTLSTLYARADLLHLTEDYPGAGAPGSRRPKLVWSRPTQDT